MRLVGVLIKFLPMESAFNTAVRDAMTPEQLAEAGKPGRGHGRWSHTNMLLASIVDQLMLGRYEQTDGSRPAPPLVRRPGVIERRVNPKLAALLEIIRANRGGIPGG